MEVYYIICLFIFGTIFGSFYNVVGSRLAHGESIVSPGSHCTNCKHPLGALELIPVLSFFLQRKNEVEILGEKIAGIASFMMTVVSLVFVLLFPILFLDLQKNSSSL